MKPAFISKILVIVYFFAAFVVAAQDTIFYPGRKLKEIVKHTENGLKTGEWKYYYESGKLCRTGNFENGEAIGEWKMY